MAWLHKHHLGRLKRSLPKEGDLVYAMKEDIMYLWLDREGVAWGISGFLENNGSATIGILYKYTGPKEAVKAWLHPQ